MALGDAIREATKRQREAADAVRRAAEESEQEQPEGQSGTPVARRASS